MFPPFRRNKLIQGRACFNVFPRLNFLDRVLLLNDSAFLPFSTEQLPVRIKVEGSRIPRFGCAMSLKNHGIWNFTPVKLSVFLTCISFHTNPYFTEIVLGFPFPSFSLITVNLPPLYFWW
jgi:hypothetical protein